MEWSKINHLFLLLLVLLITCVKKHVLSKRVEFDQNYVVTYSPDHFLQLEGGIEIQLSLDRITGTAFQSKLRYGSGYFQMKLKLPSKHSPGVVTTFYREYYGAYIKVLIWYDEAQLHSSPENNSGPHDEVDFEFLGTNGPLYTLQTNVFANDIGGREQRLHLWFDPTLAFHDYAILWNSHQIVFFIDGVPIRVFKNYTSIGGRYPSQPMMVKGSIWNGEGWASEGKKVDWSQAPFQANYKGFGILGCPFGNQCGSKAFSWNTRDKWLLNPQQQKAYEYVKRKYVYYNYCSTPKGRQLYKECQFE